jgi:hypothetical protein
MTIKITDIEYDLYDVETNPLNEITPEDYELPKEIVITQDTIDKLYGMDPDSGQSLFKLDQDIKELVECHTGFGTTNFKFNVLSS